MRAKRFLVFIGVSWDEGTYDTVARILRFLWAEHCRMLVVSTPQWAAINSAALRSIHEGAPDSQGIGIQ
jgi:hypothetical protein